MENSLRKRLRPQVRRAQPQRVRDEKHARAVALLDILSRQRRGPIDGPASLVPNLPIDPPGRIAGDPGGSSSAFPFGFTRQKSDPETGRLLQAEPIGRQDQHNLNAFVGNDPANRFAPDGKQTGDHRPTAVRIIGGTDIKNGIFYTYQLADGNGGRVRGYMVRENLKLVSVEGDQRFRKFNDNEEFVGTSDQGTFKDDVGLPREDPISSDTYMIITAEQWFTVRGPDGIEFDLDTIFTHIITVSDGKVEVETRGGN